MALSVPTLLTSKTTQNSNTAQTTDSFTPTGDALLLVITGIAETNLDSTSITVTDTLTGTGVWTEVPPEFQDIDGVRTLVSISYAIAGSSPGSGTVTVTTNGSALNRWNIHVAEVTGHDTTTPVAQDAKNKGVDTTLTVTLAASPASSSMVFGAIVESDSASITPGTGFTELADTAAGVWTLQTQYDLDNADTTCDWSTLDGINNVGVAIEISEAGGAGGQTISAAGDIASLEAFGTLQLNLVISAAGNISSGEAIGSHQLNLILSAAGNISSEEAIGTLELLSGLVISAAGNISSGEAIGSHQLNLILSAAGNISSEEAIGTLRAIVGANEFEFVRVSNINDIQSVLDSRVANNWQFNSIQNIPGRVSGNFSPMSILFSRDVGGAVATKEYKADVAFTFTGAQDVITANESSGWQVLAVQENIGFIESEFGLYLIISERDIT